MSKGGLRTDFPVKKIAEDTYVLSDFGMANCYLAIGEDKALLMDCGVGIGDMLGAVRKITDKPLMVVGTHGHVDHMGGDGQFDKVYLHKADTGKNYRFMTSYTVRKIFMLASKGTVDPSITKKDVVKYKTRPEVIPIDDGYVFDLGGRKLTVVHSVGHTYGSILLLDDKTKIAFVGDNICPSPWLFLPNTSFVDEWLVSAKKIYEISADYAPWWGHEGGLLTRELIANVIKIGEEVLVKWPKNKFFSTIKFYPSNDRVNGSVVFRTGHVHAKKSK